MRIMKRPTFPKKKRTPDAPFTKPAERPFEAQSLFKYFPTLELDKLKRLAEAMSVARLNRGNRVLGDLAVANRHPSGYKGSDRGYLAAR